MFLQRTWGRVSNEWLVSKAASRLFGAAAIIVLFATPVVFGLVEIPDEPLISWTNLAEMVLGMATSVSIFFLWTGMLWHWTQCNTSAKTMKKIWFLVLVFGVWWGAILYYFFAYWGSREKAETPSSSPMSSSPHRKGPIMAVFGYFLLVGWIGLFATVALAFAFPKGMSTILRPIAGYLVLIPTSLLIGTVIYGVTRIYHMRRT